ncbi:MAG: hypothetical protein BV458_06315 [Thermoplasmata archaeon M9B2D]|nr:MAG: hypothetical protein BV458_06315 [Thermoplasmata archaeon M9B2D]
MRKKIVGIVVCMLLISSTTSMVLFSDTVKVEASGGGQQGVGCVNLDYDWVWFQVQEFANVIRKVNWSQNGGNGIPKGRAWATAGENYTRDTILWPNMGITDNPCGLTGYTNLTIGYINSLRPKQYSSKIIIKDYGLTISENGDLYKELSYSEMFPIGIGMIPWKEGGALNESWLTNTFGFTDAEVRIRSLWNGGLIQDFREVSCEFLNTYNELDGQAVFLNTTDPLPENHDVVFILKEEPASEEKIQNLSDSEGIILIENSTKTYTFQNSSLFNCSIARLNGTDSNFIKVLSEIKNGSNYTVDNFLHSEILIFSNYSNASCCPGPDYVIIVQLSKEGDYSKVMRRAKKWSLDGHCKGIIMSGVNDSTHVMTHTVRGWNWFGTLGQKYYRNRYALPIFSINRTLGKHIITAITNNIDVTVTGFIQQQFRKQTNENPGVNSSNVVAYRNITHSPNDAIFVLGNRYDGWWGETPGDSGVGGAILLGIAKYFNDNNITPKYNLTFLFTTGEEYGMRGAQHYVDSHPQGTGPGKYNFIAWIGFDQLGFHYPPNVKHTFGLITNRLLTIKPILQEIERQTNYEKKTDYLYGFAAKAPLFIPVAAEDFVWNDVCDTILFEKSGKNSGKWGGHHQVGENYTEGDSLQYIDRNDTNVTFEMAWNVTKYFTVNPDCQFDGTITYTRTDSPDDKDSELDTITATMPIQSILPHDMVRIKAELRRDFFPYTIAHTMTQDYIVTDETINYTINVTLPPDKPAGYHTLTLKLYNSTGRIDVIIWPHLYDTPEETETSNSMFLKPRGNDPPITPTKPDGPISVKRWQKGYWNSTSPDPNNDRIGQKWFWNYDTFPNIYTPTSLSDTDYFNKTHRYSILGRHQISVKAYDEYSTLWHPYESGYSEILEVQVTPWCSISKQQQTHQERVIHVVNGSSHQFYGLLSGGQSHLFEWDFHDQSQSRHSTEQNPTHTYTDLGVYNVTFNVTDEATQLTGSTFIHVRVSDLDSDFNLSYYHGAAPNTVISFRNTSKAKTGNTVTNITWDFDDGTISYESIVNHSFDVEGVYNVTLTVKDSENNIDVDYVILRISSEPVLPEIPSVQGPGVLPPNSEAAIIAEIIATDRNLSSVTVNITTPNGTTGNYTMTEVVDNIFIYTMGNTSQNGYFNFTIWVTDIENNTNSTSGNFSMIVPLLYFDSPTPPHNMIENRNWVMVNVTVLDPLSTSAFIDWNCSLKGYWPMDVYNTTGVYDNSSYGNFGRFCSTMNPENIRAGRYGNGVLFNGEADYVDLGNSSSLDLGTGDFTFMVWEKSDVSSYQGNGVILTNQPGQEDWKGYGFGVVDGAYLYAAQSSEEYVEVEGTVDVTDGDWHHLAYVHDDGYYSLYVDGVFDTKSKWISSYNITNTQHTCLAYDGQTSGWCYFAGMLDELQLYNRAVSREEINASYNNGLFRLYHNFTGLTEGDYLFYGHAVDTSGNMSQTETRTITIDFDPQIIGVFASPSTVGFGYNLTITANVTDTGSGVNTVNVNITYPDETHGNYTMTHVTGDSYQYVFMDVWLAGQYNYTLWAMDHSNNSNSSSGHHFHVSADASMSIATLQNSYTGDDYINITDPPNPPENYMVVARGLTWDKYYDAITGQNILEVSTGPVNYQGENGTWIPINATFSSLTGDHPAYVYGYRSGNDRGLYGVYFKSNAQLDWPVAFTYNRSDDPTIHAIRSKLVGVGYVDPQSNWTYQYLQNVQSSQGQTNDYSITYPGVFTGADVIWSYGNTGLKEEIILSNTTKTMLQNHPPSQYGLNDASSYLVFITKLDYQSLNLYNGSGVLDGNVTISDIGVEFRDVLGQFRCALPLGEVYEMNNESMRHKLTYRIIHINGNTYLLSGLKVTDLNTMMFPVAIDPTLTVYAADFITIGQYKFKTTSYIYRGFVHFNTSSLPSNAYLDNATLSLYKRTDYSTADFDITIQNGQPTYPHDPVQPGDYDKTCYLGNGGSLNTADLISGYNAISLTNLTWINTTGLTKLCLRSGRDISGTAPTGNEFVSVYSKDFIFSYPPKLVIYYRNQSKIMNTGSTDINGYLLMQVQYYNETLESWIVDNDTVNETTPRTINSSSQLGLDTIFNGQVRASDLTHGSGLYRVYAAFQDPEGNILRTNDETDLEAWWQFSKT